MKYASDRGAWGTGVHAALRWAGVVLVAVAACLLVGACVSREVKEAKRDRGLKFPHKTHVEQGMNCTDCHTPADDKARYTIPNHDTCSTCHEIPSDVTDTSKCSLCHTRDDVSLDPLPRLLDEEKKFDHSAHEAKGVACAVCHKDPDGSVLPAGSLKRFCMDCHGKTDPKLNECGVCHSTERKTAVPTKRPGTQARVAHDVPQVWERIHGRESKPDPAFCALCHTTPEDCDACHRVNAPDDHTLSWRRKTHGLEAGWDRSRCSACHEEDACRRCHESTEPASHRGGWGRPANLHCVQCHYPPEKTGCVTCHEEVDHEKAMPSPHTVGIYPANCALCHPGGLPHRAPHAMNSTTRCFVCHR